MLVLEAKLKGKPVQFMALDEAIRTAQFIRNSCLRFWMDHLGTSRNDLYKYCKTLADNPEFPWAKQLNSQARQAHMGNELGLLLQSSSRTAGNRSLAREAIPSSRSRKPVLLWNTR
jgi:hypothetical protein